MRLANIALIMLDEGLFNQTLLFASDEYFSMKEVKDVVRPFVPAAARTQTLKW